MNQILFQECSAALSDRQIKVTGSPRKQIECDMCKDVFCCFNGVFLTPSHIFCYDYAVNAKQLCSLVSSLLFLSLGRVMFIRFYSVLFFFLLSLSPHDQFCFVQHVTLIAGMALKVTGEKINLFLPFVKLME